MLNIPSPNVTSNMNCQNMSPHALNKYAYAYSEYIFFPTIRHIAVKKKLIIAYEKNAKSSCHRNNTVTTAAIRWSVILRKSSRKVCSLQKKKIMSAAEVRYFVGAFVRFLHGQIAERQPSDPDDTVESLEVAVQCLETAFQLSAKKKSTNANDEWDEQHPLAGVDAFQLFRHSYDAGDISAERKLEAEQLKNDGNGLMKDEKYVEALRAYSR